ncbi:hypothetical protein ACSSVY_001330 [Roseovarius sp. MBR-51]
MLIKLKEYERIFQIVSAVVESEGGDPAHSCIHYSLFGANILVDHFRLDAKVRCGQIKGPRVRRNGCVEWPTK